MKNQFACMFCNRRFATQEELTTHGATKVRCRPLGDGPRARKPVRAPATRVKRTDEDSAEGSSGEDGESLAQQQKKRKQPSKRSDTAVKKARKGPSTVLDRRREEPATAALLAANQNSSYAAAIDAEQKQKIVRLFLKGVQSAVLMVVGVPWTFKFEIARSQYETFFKAKFYLDLDMLPGQEHLLTRADVRPLADIDALLGGSSWRCGDHVHNRLKIAGFSTHRTPTGFAHFDFRGALRVVNPAGIVTREPSLAGWF